MRKWNLHFQREDCALLRDKKGANHWLHMEPRKHSLVILLCLSPKRATMDLEVGKSLQESHSSKCQQKWRSTCEQLHSISLASF